MPGADEDLPAYFSGPAEEAALPTRPAREVALAGARWLATAVADAHASMTAVPPPSPYPSAAFLVTANAGSTPPRRAPTAITGGFLRMVELPGPRLGAMLDEWWSAAAVDGSSTVGRLRLGPPSRDRLGGFTFRGRIRRRARWHWTPVVVEMWPRHGRWTMITITPQSGVFATRHYFRAGHAAIERLTRTLSATRAAAAYG